MWDWISALKELDSTRHPAVMITVTRSEGSTPREVGAKIIAKAPNDFQGTIGGGNLEYLALSKVPHFLSSAKAGTIKYPLGASTGQCCGGMVELLFEPLHCGPQLFIFGAGHVGQALATVMQDTPFSVFLIDDRNEWATRSPRTTQTLCLDPIAFAQSSHYWERTFAVVLTHNHALDEQLIDVLAQEPLAFLGLIGSRTKWLRFKKRLSQKGLSTHQIQKVKCPIGIDIGGKSPKEVAISIASQLIQTFYDSKTQISTHPASRGKVFPVGDAERSFSLSGSTLA